MPPVAQFASTVRVVCVQVWGSGVGGLAVASKRVTSVRK